MEREQNREKRKWDRRGKEEKGKGGIVPQLKQKSTTTIVNKKLSYRRETARQLRIHAQLTRCFSAVAVLGIGTCRSCNAQNRRIVEVVIFLTFKRSDSRICWPKT